MSIVVVTSNNLPFLALSLRSVLVNTDAADYELVVVVSGSKDGSAAHVRKLMKAHRHVRAVFNDTNRSFAAANNQGVAATTGALLVLLNDDTVVPAGWLRPLVRHLDDPSIGLIGSVSNRAGNEAQVEGSYDTYGEFVRFASDHGRAHEGEHFDIRTATMFCVGMRRDVWERVGPLDERFEVGMFEDEDYAMRVRAAGCRVVCAEDSFVHHFGQASLGKLAATGDYGPLFHANRQRWEAKWGHTWEPYRHRPITSYQTMVERVRELVHDAVPRDAAILVASKGDDQLLQFEGRRASHFPQTADGAYPGHHPADSAAAICHLEELRSRGSQFFLLPSSASWWLSHYTGFRDHLETSYVVAARRDDAGVIYALKEAVHGF